MLGLGLAPGLKGSACPTLVIAEGIEGRNPDTLTEAPKAGIDLGLGIGIGLGIGLGLGIGGVGIEVRGSPVGLIRYHKGRSARRE